MKCIVLLLVTCAAVKGRAPYLPSGWRPEGAPFLLPFEVEKSSENPPASSVEVEASGTDSLREYGPPVVTNEIARQALPDDTTEQVFNPQVSQEVVDAKEDSKEIVDLKEDSENIALTDSEVNTEETVNVNKSEDIEEKEISVEEKVLEQNVDDRESSVIEGKSEIVGEKANNIQQALENLGNEIISQQISTEAEEKTVQKEAGVSDDVPSAFLEYGPPGSSKRGNVGFLEYGPPKYNAPSLALQSVSNRRRRFSPRHRTWRSV